MALRDNRAVSTPRVIPAEGASSSAAGGMRAGSSREYYTVIKSDNLASLQRVSMKEAKQSISSDSRMDKVHMPPLLAADRGRNGQGKYEGVERVFYLPEMTEGVGPSGG